MLPLSIEYVANNIYIYHKNVFRYISINNMFYRTEGVVISAVVSGDLVV
jgi:hypothetical protein